METPPRTPRGYEDSFLDGPGMDRNGSDAWITQLATLLSENYTGWLLGHYVLTEEGL